MQGSPDGAPPGCSICRTLPTFTMYRISTSDFAVFLLAVSIVVSFFLVVRHFLRDAARGDEPRRDAH